MDVCGQRFYFQFPTGKDPTNTDAFVYLAKELSDLKEEVYELKGVWKSSLT